MNQFEIDFCKILYHNEILDKYFEQVQDYFYSCDFEGGSDEKVSFKEILEAVDGLGVFVDQKVKDGDVSLSMLERALEKIDLV